MPSSKTKTEKGLTYRDGLWLLAALALHACILLIPVRQADPGPESPDPQVVELRLVALQKPPPVRPEPEDQEPPPPMPDPPPPTQPPPEPLLEPPQEITQHELVEPDITPPGAQQSEKALSTAFLLQEATNRKWNRPDEEQDRQLGLHVPQGIPDNWRPSIALEKNRFDGMRVPRKVEIVDRWISQDGSHNVVLNTPNGETLCGRGQAWDPMQPLVEHVMQFRLCAGGGKRTFEMPHRYHKNTPLDR